MRTSYPPSSVNAPFYRYSKLQLPRTEESRNRRKSKQTAIEGQGSNWRPSSSEGRTPTDWAMSASNDSWSWSESKFEKYCMTALYLTSELTKQVWSANHLVSQKLWPSSHSSTQEYSQPNTEIYPGNVHPAKQRMSVLGVTRKHWLPVRRPPLRTGSTDHLRTGVRTTPTDHPQSKIKNKNKDNYHLLLLQ